MQSLEFPTTWMKIKRQYFLIHIFHLNLITVPHMDESRKINKQKNQ